MFSQLLMRRSIRIRDRKSVCTTHYHQADEDDEMALCGLLSINNMHHMEVLTYDDCQRVARTWVGATSNKDKRLRAIADDRGRGAFSIEIFKVALEKKGFGLLNLGKKLKNSVLTASAAWTNRPCLVLCSNSSNATSHAICLCMRGNLHDPDWETPFNLADNGHEEGNLQAWLQRNDLLIQNVYKTFKIDCPSAVSKRKKIVHRTKRGHKKKFKNSIQ